MLWSGVLCAVEPYETTLPLSQQRIRPWLTGPLIAPSGAAYPKGHFGLNNYLFVTTNTGNYTKHWHRKSARNFTILNPQWIAYVGVTSWMDVSVFPQMFYQTTSNQHSTQFGDLPIGLDFQLLPIDATPYFPGIKFSILEVFPTGPYQRLNPKKLLTDSCGKGAFSTLLELVLYKLYHIKGRCFLSTFLSGAYSINAPVSVHGLNAYGGGKGTRGTVYGGNSFQGIFSWELTLTQNWVIALDSVYQHVNKTSFRGSSSVHVGNPSSEQISFAPAIEYNFNKYLGVITGCWFTAWGRNSTAFCSGVINFVLNY